MKTKTVFVAGHNGMAGSALVRHLKKNPDIELILKDRAQLELVNQSAVHEFFTEHKPDEVYIAAAKVGGIYANNTYPADFIYENLMVECNIIKASHANKVSKLLLLGSSCIYPRMAEQPMQESALLTGELEVTNEPYAVAKIAGIKLCEAFNRQYGCDFRSVMPTNLYGENDNFHPQNSHVIPAMMGRFHQAKTDQVDEVVVWGSGSPMREFLHVDDMAAASVYVMDMSLEEYQHAVEPRFPHINVGTGVDCTIRELAETMREVTEYKGRLKFDTSKPDGTPRKLLDVSRLNSLGWSAQIDLAQGLKRTYDWYLKNESQLRGTKS